MNPLMEFVQQYGPLFAVLAAIATVMGLAFTIYRAAHDRQVRALHRQIDELKRDGPEGLRPLVKELQGQLAREVEAARSLRDGLRSSEEARLAHAAEMQREVERLRGVGETLSGELEGEREKILDKDRVDKARVNLLKRAMNLQGKVWERKVLQSAPAFRPLAERHVPILSILNLKGGVGKTTVTANLGAALSAKGYRVLLIDLDLQGSLSSLFMSESALVDLSKAGKLLQHSLLDMAERRKANLLDCCVPIFDGRSAIIPNADSMAYAELNLTMQWLLRLGKRDTRFLLRKALHQKRITSRFDIVLMDCPPLFNTCCVNALAVSDYAIIPVVPSRKAAERVPLLLERLQSLHRILNPQLQVMGVLLNRTYGATLTAKEQDLWRDMLDHCKDLGQLPVHDFKTFIRQTTEVRDIETEFYAPLPGSDLHGMFSRLVAEVEERLPNDCRRTANAAL